MITTKNKVWIISDGNTIDLDLNTAANEKISGPVTEHKISEIAMYLLSPLPIKMEDYVIGCKVHHKAPASSLLKRFFNKLSVRKEDSAKNTEEFTEDILITPKHNPPLFRDNLLNKHFMRIKEQLLPYKPIQKKLSSLDIDHIEEITAIGEDMDKNRYQITLGGSITDKINFILEALTRKTKITLGKAHIQDGLFDFRGYSFNSFNTNNAYPLVRCFHENQTKYCVLTKNYKFNYWVDDNKLIDYLRLFEQSLQTDAKLNGAINLCIKGKANPFKLFFTDKYEQDYSKRYLPKIYREMMFSHNIAPNEIEAITQTLNKKQSVVFFSYAPTFESDRQKLFTNISVMHDLKALDSIKESIPRVYSEISKKTAVFETQQLYLLDSMRGCQDV